MNLRLSADMEKGLEFFANAMQVTKTELVKPCIERLLEDLEDYYFAKKALEEVQAGGRTYSHAEVMALFNVEN
ncbi:MAG: DUF6290 family protein [Bacillota bacterium]